MTDDPFSLDQLRDIVQPDAVSWWPPAVGWWFVLALIAVWAIYVIVTVATRWRASAYRREGLRLLDEIESAAGSGAQRASSLVQISSVMKRVALAAYPRETVASLSGAEWLGFLNRTAAASDFTAQPASLLGTASCEAATELDASSFARVCAAARTWIELHDGMVPAVESNAGDSQDGESQPC